LLANLRRGQAIGVVVGPGGKSKHRATVDGSKIQHARVVAGRLAVVRMDGSHVAFTRPKDFLHVDRESGVARVVTVLLTQKVEELRNRKEVATGIRLPAICVQLEKSIATDPDI